jgi:preprotein translocase subunit SecY
VSIVNSFQNVFRIPELKSRILFTLGLLGVYRIGAHIPTPGIRSEALSALLTAKGGALMGFFDMFSGGALSRATIFALGIMPYISASIILQLLTVVIPTLGRLAKEGEAGRKKITQYTRYGTVVISIVQSIGIAVGLDINTTIDWIAQKTSWLANGIYKAGAVAREPQGIVKLQYNETT